MASYHDVLMLVEITPLWHSFIKLKEQGKKIVLSTIVSTIGSSYKKRGAMMLISEDGHYYGLLSGGCLEADIAEHAKDIFQNGIAKVLDYDLSDDSVFGLGMGCDGSIQVLLQLLDSKYQPFSLFNPTKHLANAANLYLNHRAEDDLKAGDFFYRDGTKTTTSNPKINSLISQNKIHKFKLTTPPKIAIVGAASDTWPLCHMIHNVYWHGYSFDHRIGLLNSENFPPGWDYIHCTPSQIQETLSAYDFDAAIIMSHNVDRDAAYLAYFAQSKTPFIGLLGPPARRDKVLLKSGIHLEDLNLRLHAPVGLNIGGRMPENIAVSIVAQLQEFFYKKHTSHEN